MPSAKVLEQKKQIVEALVARLNAACAGVIVDYKGITVTDEEVETAYVQVAQMYQMTVEQLKQTYGGENEENLRKDILLKKAIAVLEANAEITVQE